MFKNTAQKEKKNAEHTDDIFEGKKVSVEVLLCVALLRPSLFILSLCR